MQRLKTEIHFLYKSSSEYIWTFPWIHGLQENLKVFSDDGLPIWVTDCLIFLGDFNYRSTLPRSEQHINMTLVQVISTQGKSLIFLFIL